jgi:uncharacterized protein YjhX (UPF0386 family)
VNRPSQKKIVAPLAKGEPRGGILRRLGCDKNKKKCEKGGEGGGNIKLRKKTKEKILEKSKDGRPNRITGKF